MAEKLNSSEAEALRRARVIAASAGPVTGLTTIGQSYTIQPGTFDRNEHILILGQESGEVWFLRGNNLYSQPPGEFLERHQLAKISGQVHRSTRWIIPLARTTITFAVGVVTGISGGGVVLFASWAVIMAKLYSFYDLNRQRVATVSKHLGIAASVLKWFAQHCPVTHSQLVQLLGEASWEALRSIPQGIRGEDIAITLGKLLGGLSTAPDASIRTLLTVLRSTVKTFALRVPGIAVRGGVDRARAVADALVDQMRQRGFQLNGAQTNGIHQEFQRYPEAAAKLEQLQRSLAEMLPVLEGLARSIQIEQQVPSFNSQRSPQANRP